MSSKGMIWPLLDVLYRFNLKMALLKNIPILRALSAENWTHLDNVWCSDHTTDLFVQCNTNPGLQGPNTDHLPILSILNLPTTHTISKLTHNFQATDWRKFSDHLDVILAQSKPKRLTLRTKFREALSTINSALKLTIKSVVLVRNSFISIYFPTSNSFFPRTLILSHMFSPLLCSYHIFPFSYLISFSPFTPSPNH